MKPIPGSNNDSRMLKKPLIFLIWTVVMFLVIRAEIKMVYFALKRRVRTLLGKFKREWF